mgnify:CR=1 FL=1
MSRPEPLPPAQLHSLQPTHHSLRPTLHHETKSIELANANALSRLGRTSPDNISSAVIDININIPHSSVPEAVSRSSTPTNTPGKSTAPKSLRTMTSKTQSKTRREHVKDRTNAVHAQAEEGAVVDTFQYGHQLKHKLNSKTRGTHPELRNKFDKHLIDVIRNTHSHLLTDVHHDIMAGIIEARISRQLAMMNAVTNGGGSGNPGGNRKGGKKKNRKQVKSDNETDLEAYASHMFAVSGVMMRDGVQDRNFVSHKYDTISLWYYEFQYNWWYQAVMAISYIVLSILVLFETPAPPSMEAPISLTLTLECLCLMIQCVDILIRSKALRHPFQERWLLAKIICVAFCSVDWVVQVVCVVGVPTPAAMSVAFDFRILRAVRVVFWIEYYNVIRREFTQAVETMKKILPAIFLVIISVIFFAGLGIALFPRRQLAIALDIDMTEGDLYFKDILAAIFQLFYLFAGAVNFPDVMLPAFIQNDHWWYIVIVVVYFLLFLMISVFVLQNILIATVIEMHRDIEIRDIIARYLRKHLAFAAAFEVIYNVQDLEQTRIRLRRAIRHEQLDELDNAITDTLRLQAKLPIALPEKVTAMKLRSSLLKQQRVKEEIARKEGERKDVENGTDGVTASPPVPLSEKRKSSRSNHMNQQMNDGEVDIESQRLHKSTFIRALQQLGQDVLFRTGTKYEMVEENEKTEEGSFRLKKSSRRRVKNRQSTLQQKQKMSKGDGFVSTPKLELLQEQTDGRLDDIWASIYDIVGDDAARGTEKDDSHKQKETPNKSDASDALSDGVNIPAKSFEQAGETVNVNSFMKLPDVLICKYGEREQIQASETASSCDRFCMGGLYHSLRPTVASMWFNVLCICSVVCSFIIEIFVVSLASVNDMVYLDAGKTNILGFVLFNIIDIGLSIFFIVEMIVRIFAVGWKGYWSNPWWRVDGTIAICTFFIVFIRLGIVTTVTDFRGLTVLMMISCLRGVRIVKFFAVMPSLKVILVTVSKVARKSSHFLLLLLALYYVFSIIGIHMLNRGMADTNVAVQHTSWYETSYIPSPTNQQPTNITQYDAEGQLVHHDPNNTTASTNNMTAAGNAVRSYVKVVHFNNFGNAMFTLFHLTFLNNWHITAEAAMAAVQARYSSVETQSMARVGVFIYFVCMFINNLACF